LSAGRVASREWAIKNPESHDVQALQRKNENPGYQHRCLNYGPATSKVQEQIATYRVLRSAVHPPSHEQEIREASMVPGSDPVSEGGRQMNEIPFGNNPHLNDLSWQPGKLGWLYILTNEGMPNLIKVGMTTRQPWERAEELSKSTGVPAPFDVSSYMCVRDVYAAERLAHYELREFRLPNREFFHCDAFYAYCRIHGLLQGCILLVGLDDDDYPYKAQIRAMSQGFEGGDNVPF
jgi:hypothetical protein